MHFPAVKELRNKKVYHLKLLSMYFNFLKKIMISSIVS